MPLVRRLIEFSIQLSPNPQNTQPTRFGNGTDTVTLSGHRATVHVQNSGAPGGSEAQIEIYGMGQDLMNQLYQLGIAFDQVNNNKISVLAGDTDSGLSPVFGGTIFQAYADYKSAPNVPFRIESRTGFFDQIAPVDASSFPKSTDIATVMAGFARQMGVGFENSGVDGVILPPSYFPGTLKEQVRKAADDAHIRAEFVDGATKLAIWPIGKSRTTAKPVLIAAPPEGQMIGYPNFSGQGIVVENVFDPRISFGQEVHVKSSITPIDQVSSWTINKMDLALDTLMPSGQWLQTIYATASNLAPTVPPTGAR